MKKFINNVDNIVDEMLDGFAMSYPSIIKRVDGYNVIIRTNLNPQKVALISGGGSGHEPAHAGYVGYGMLDAAVAGEIFTSPPPNQIYEAIKKTAINKQALLIVKNYTGDIMNFEMAADLAKNDGITCETVVVNDDIALENSTYTAGRRGIAGTVFVHKILGAVAEQGYDLKQLKELGDRLIPQIASLGISLDACIVPASGRKSFELAADEIEIGLGIHGEPGIQRSSIKPADELTQLVVEKLIAELSISKDDKVAILVNGLGGTPLMELGIIARKVLLMLKSANISYGKVLIGNYMTSIEMPGMSISLLKLDAEIEKLLNFKANTIALQV